MCRGGCKVFCWKFRVRFRLLLQPLLHGNVDLAAATKRGVTVVRVPAYSPYAVAELTIALMLALNRKLHRAYDRVREGNFSIDGLLGSTCTAKQLA